MRKFLRFLLLLIFTFCNVYAASDTLSGVVIDSSTSLALKNVWVNVVGDSYKDSSFTDSLGQFFFLKPLPVSNLLLNENLQTKTFLRLNNGNFQWQSRAEKITIEIVNMRGKIVSTFSNSKTFGSFRVPNLATGLYFVHFHSAEQTDIYRYLCLGNNGSLSAQTKTSSTAKSLVEGSAAAAYTLTFEKIPYRTITLTLSEAQSDLQIKMQIPPNAVYQIYGMNFSPYIDGQDPNTGVIVPEKQIIDRMRIIAPYTKTIRTFSATHGLEVCGRIAHQFGLKTYINAWIGTDSVANNKEMDSLIAMAKRGEVDTAIIGSEALLRGDVTEDKLIELINYFRTAVPNVPVTTADVYGQLETRPNVIAACDFVFANFYPYWEGVKVDYAVASLYDSYQNLVKVSGGKEVIVSEAGWPSAGDTNALSVPTLENANFYFLNFISWARAMNVKIFYFEAFDESWKTSEGAVGPNWGIFDKNGAMKTGMQKVFDGDTMANNWSSSDTVDGPGTPTITFTFVPAIGSYDNLQGKVSHVVPKDYGIAVYIKVSGTWWQKPTYAQPVTKINTDGTWVCDVTTGGSDASATEFAALLIPIDYTPPTSYSSVETDKIIAIQDTIR
jgi:exo-beta-1,3-glucanase (GH17 family)